MPKFKAKRNLTLGEPGKKHMQVKAGETFECSQEYFDSNKLSQFCQMIEAPKAKEPKETKEEKKEKKEKESK
jgi:hypothetical protein